MVNLILFHGFDGRGIAVELLCWIFVNAQARHGAITSLQDCPAWGQWDGSDQSGRGTFLFSIQATSVPPERFEGICGMCNQIRSVFPSEH